jgi:phospholipid transport system substrate-binding protein
MHNDIPELSRRGALGALAATAAMLALPGTAQALTVGEARGLIDRAVADVNAVISSGASEASMLASFEKIFVKYADVPTIARSSLGPAARGASAADLAAYTKAFQRYIARKYGRRFREFIGGRIEVVDARPLKTYFEVISVAKLKGQAPFDLRWYVSDKSGRDLFFNLIIEGVNMLASERAEIGAMLDANKGSIPALAAALRKI